MTDYLGMAEAYIAKRKGQSTRMQQKRVGSAVGAAYELELREPGGGRIIPGRLPKVPRAQSESAPAQTGGYKPPIGLPKGWVAAPLEQVPSAQARMEDAFGRLLHDDRLGHEAATGRETMPGRSDAPAAERIAEAMERIMKGLGR